MEAMVLMILGQKAGLPQSRELIKLGGSDSS